MDDLTPFEARLATRLRVDADASVRGFDPRAIARAAAASAPTRPARRLAIARLTIGWPRLGLAFAMAAAAVVGALLVGSMLLRDRGELAYVDQGDLYAIAADGSNDRLLLDLPADINGVEWSPDGAWLEATDTDGTVWVIRADGTGLQRVGQGDGATWSPDGRSVAWVAVTPAGSRPIIHDLGTGADRALDLPPGTGFANRVSWFPDGSALLVPACSGCTTYLDGMRRTFRVPIDGDRATPIEGLDDAEGASLSPDGTSITTDACTFRTFPDCRGVELFDVGSGAVRIVIPGMGPTFGPIWSPDGRWLVFGQSDGPDQSDGVRLVRMAPDGTDRQVVDPAAGPGTSVASAAISPDGRRIAAVGPVADPLRDGLWILASDGSNVTFVRGPHDLPGRMRWVGWRPTSRSAMAIDEPAPGSPDPYADCARVPPNDTGYRHARTGGAAQGCVIIRADEGVDLDASTADRVDLWYGTGAAPNGESAWHAELTAGERGEGLARVPTTGLGAATCDAALAAAASSEATVSTPSVLIADLVASGDRLCVRTVEGADFELWIGGPWEDGSELVLSYRRLRP